MLDLSSNRICQIEGLDRLQRLRLLNLASNQLQTAVGLESLRALTRLDLGFNLLTSTAGIDALRGEEYSVEELDLRSSCRTYLHEQ